MHNGKSVKNHSKYNGIKYLQRDIRFATIILRGRKPAPHIENLIAQADVVGPAKQAIIFLREPAKDVKPGCYYTTQRKLENLHIEQSK
jgi:hypothetical protein